MKRFSVTIAALVVFAATAQAGGPPPMYVVVDKVVLEPSATAPERIRIEGSFVRLANVPRYEYGKPFHGFIYLSIEPGKEKECRAEWAKWQKAVGTGKAVSVGACHEAGTFLTTKIYKDGEKVTKPDAVYSIEKLGAFGPSLYAEGDLVRESPVRDLLAFAKARKAETANRR
jgi:hypothetical protein